MFERFTRQAHDTVVQAQGEARDLGHNWIGTEHLFLAALSQPEAPFLGAMTKLGLTHERCRIAVEAVRDAAQPLGTADAEALRTLGIDLAEIRRRVEANFGAGALDQPGRRARRRPTGHIPFTRPAKRALERALTVAKARKDRAIGVEHVLLGALDPDGNTAVDVLRHLGVEPDTVRAAVLADLGNAA